MGQLTLSQSDLLSWAAGEGGRPSQVTHIPNKCRHVHLVTSFNHLFGLDEQIPVCTCVLDVRLWFGNSLGGKN